MSILCYHALEPGWTSPLSLDPEVFERQLRWLHRHRRLVSIREAADVLGPDLQLPRRTAALTFDDGFRSCYDHLLPLVRRFRTPVTIFLVANTLTESGQPVDWVDDPPPRPLHTLTRDQVKEMQESGIDFASHSSAHTDLRSLSEDECVADLRRSRDVLEDLLGHRVDQLAYPRGLHDEHVRRATRRAGFTHGFALPAGPEPSSAYSVPRVGVYRGNGTTTLALKSSRAFTSAVRHPGYGLMTSAANSALRRLRG